MNKILLLTYLLMFISSSCKKQELDTTNPMTGKWKVSTLTVESRCTTVPSSPTFNPGKPFKKVTVEIFSRGEIRIEYEDEMEKLKIVEITELPSTAKFFTLPEAVRRYDCKVRDRTGHVFNFHFYFSEDNDQMIGTYWTPDHPYHTTQIPNSVVVHCSWGAMAYQGYEAECFAVYQKI